MSKTQGLKETLINKILKVNGVLFGGYVYKTIINGDSSRDIDVIHADPHKLAEELKEEFHCVEAYMENHGLTPYKKGVALDCSHGRQNVHIDIVPPFQFLNYAPQWFIYDKQGLRCNDSIAPDTCFNKLMAVRKRTMKKDTLRRAKDVEYFTKERVIDTPTPLKSQEEWD